jgi:hypothetical protein
LRRAKQQETGGRHAHSIAYRSPAVYVTSWSGALATGPE